MEGVGTARGQDVTGGMRHRLESAAALAARGITSWIVDGREPDVLATLAAGEPDVGTRIPGVREAAGS